jgi:hypothetical protein
MPVHSPDPSSGGRLHPRVVAVFILALVAAAYVALQHSSLAPFPHRADDFVAGLAVGLAIVAVVGWLSGRR